VISICSLFNDVLSVTQDYEASNEMVTYKWWIEKDLEGSNHSLILRYYASIHLEGLRKTTENLSQDSRSPVLDLNPRPNYEARVLTTQPQCSAREVQNVMANAIRNQSQPTNPGV
jgi:hypothetical protein